MIIVTTIIECDHCHIQTGHDNPSLKKFNQIASARQKNWKIRGNKHYCPSCEPSKKGRPAFTKKANPLSDYYTDKILDGLHAKLNTVNSTIRADDAWKLNIGPYSSVAASFREIVKGLLEQGKIKQIRKGIYQIIRADEPRASLNS